MRLHRLEVTAFGPFSGTEEIDFDALSDAGLFLIQGQTGAGKTSVLDAVCYALYGQVPGARNAVKGLRSDHAADGAAPRVVLETTIRGRRLRVTRSPGWERPKLRGTGTTSEKPKALLEELEHGAWVGLSNRIDEASDLIGQLLGMTAEQFCQVAMLPQGEFAGFLRAKAEERRKVLERLFTAEVYTHVEKWLADRRAATGRDAGELRAGAEAIAERVGAAAELIRSGDREAIAAWHRAAGEDRRSLLEGQLERGELREVRLAVANRPGTVAEIALALGRAGVNIEDMGLAPAADMRTGSISIWVTGERDAERTQRVAEDLGHAATVVASGS